MKITNAGVVPMAQAAKTRGTTGQRTGRHALTGRRRGVGLDGLLSAPPPQLPPRDEYDRAWASATRRAARFAVLALPAYAAALVWLSVTPAPDPLAAPAAWAQRVTDAGYGSQQLLIGPGMSLLGLVALVALTTLLAGARGRGFAAGGLLAGLSAVSLWLPQQGVSMFAAPALVDTASGGPETAAQTYSQMYTEAGGLAGAGTALFTLAWVLLGVAVWRSRVLNRSDGVLLVLAAPLLGVAGLFQGLLVPLGALLLLAAGVGIAWTGGRAAQSAVWPSTSSTPTTSGSPTTAR